MTTTNGAQEIPGTIPMETRFVRLCAMVHVLTDLLAAVLDTLPNREAVIKSFEKMEDLVGAMAIGETFTDEELEALKEARRHLLLIALKPGEAPPT